MENSSLAAEYEALSWVNAAFIQDALRRDNDSNVNVTSVSVTRGTAPGENFSSIIYRVTATLDNGEMRSLLLKIPPKGGEKRTVESGFFRIEANMLGNILPAMKKLLDRAVPGRFAPLGARCPLYGTEPTSFLILEDLKPQGFRMAVRHRGLGLRHCLLALRSLARYHASSAALLHEDPSIAKDLPNPFRSCKESMEQYAISVFQMASNVCRKWPGFEEYAEILAELTPLAIGTLMKLNDPRPGKFNVINHGDYWTNNMMFKYAQNGQLEDFRIVDLQISHPTSPAIDLLYFLNTSLSDEVSTHHRPMLLREYYITLTETLELLGVQGYSFEELTEDIDAYGSYAVFGAISVWPLARSEAVPDIEGQINGDSSNSTFLYETTAVKLWLQRMLPEFKSKGWLEVPRWSCN